MKSRLFECIYHRRSANKKKVLSKWLPWSTRISLTLMPMASSNLSFTRPIPGTLRIERSCMKALMDWASNWSWNCPFGLFYTPLVRYRHAKPGYQTNLVRTYLETAKYWVDCDTQAQGNVGILLRASLQRRTVRLIPEVSRGILTLFGAIPALTVNCDSLKTVSRICCTHSSAVKECSSQ